MIGNRSRTGRGINPWLLGKDSDVSDAGPERISESVAAELTGPVVPQHGRGAPQPTDALPIRTGVDRQQPRLWVVGAHGGSGESCIASLDPGWAAAEHAYPDPATGGTVLLSCRGHVTGLLAAQQAAIQWASGSLSGLRLLGLVIIADSPGKPPKPIRDLAQLITGGLAHDWALPWCEAWRLGESPPAAELPVPFRRLVADLHRLSDTPSTAPDNRPAPDPEFPALGGNSCARH